VTGPGRLALRCRTGRMASVWLWYGLRMACVWLARRRQVGLVRRSNAPAGDGVLAAATIALALSATSAGAADAFSLDRVRAHLFYERSGTLSDDVVGNGGLFNTVIGEGWASEPASDVLVVVELTGPAGEGVTETPLVIEVEANRDGWQTVARRSFDFLYTVPGQSPRVARAVWVQDTTCSPLRIRVSHGTDRMSAEVPFNCGE